MLLPIEYCYKKFYPICDFAARCLVSPSLNLPLMISTEKKEVKMILSESTEIVGQQIKHKNKSNFS